MSSKLWISFVCVFVVAWLAASCAALVTSDWSMYYQTPGPNGPERVDKGELAGEGRVLLSALFGLVASVAFMCVVVPLVLLGRGLLKRRRTDR